MSCAVLGSCGVTQRNAAGRGGVWADWHARAAHHHVMTARWRHGIKADGRRHGGLMACTRSACAHAALSAWPGQGAIGLEGEVFYGIESLTLKKYPRPKATPEAVAPAYRLGSVWCSKRHAPQACLLGQVSVPCSLLVQARSHQANKRGCGAAREYTHAQAVHVPGVHAACLLLPTCYYMHVCN